MTARMDMQAPYPVCDLFASIQGEASWTGRAMLFVRFSGCPLSCPWCDEPRHRDPDAIRALTATDILTALRQTDPLLRSVLLTGGEPLAVPGIDRLVHFLKDHGYWLAMESSGVGGVLPTGLDWVTLSPKTPLPESLFAAAHEIKYLVTDAPTERQTAEIQQRAQTHANVWVQPLSEGGVNGEEPSTINPHALQHCLRHVKQSGGRIRLSLQTHKWIGLP